MNPIHPLRGINRRVLILLLAMGASLTSLASSGPDLAEILARHAEARGGKARLDAVTSVRVELHLTEPEFEADLLYRALRPMMARVDVTIEGKNVYTEAFDGTSAWQRSGAGAPVRDSSPAGTAALRLGAIGNLYPLHALAGLGHRMELMERAEIDGVLYHTLKVTYDDGSVNHYYLDPDTFLIARERSLHALHPDLDPNESWTEKRRSDFRTVDGIVRAFRTRTIDLRTGEEIQSIEVKRVVVNPALDPGLFDRPE